MPDLLHLLQDITVSYHGPAPSLKGEVLSDSRLISMDDCFIALEGNKFDGHAFIERAVLNGARIIIHSKPLTEYKDKISYIQVSDSKTAIARLGYLAYTNFPPKMVAVTGTNGKTSVVNMVRQLAAICGHHCASLGTIGLKIDDLPATSTAEIFTRINNLLNLTTMPWLELRYILSMLKKHNIKLVAMEASSHGLHQGRIEGLKFQAVAFTNLTQDHLDYHKSLENYAAAKAKLLEENLSEGATVVINSDADYADYMISKAAHNPNLKKLIVFGRTQPNNLPAIPQQEYWQVKRLDTLSEGLAIEVRVGGKLYSATLPLLGRFQAENLLAALGVLVGCDLKFEELWPISTKLHGVQGRMELIKTSTSQVIVIDYAHTPDALEKAITEMKQHFPDYELAVVFGCGGERDPSKRPIMGKISSKFADLTIVTDDNPRNENADTIRAQIISGCKSGNQVIEIPNRAEAIRYAMSNNKPRAILIAGKGHEQYQQIGDHKLPYSDYDVALENTPSKS